MLQCECRHMVKYFSVAHVQCVKIHLWLTSSKRIRCLARANSVTLQKEMEHLQVFLLCFTKQHLSQSVTFSLVGKMTFPDTGAAVNWVDKGIAEGIHNTFLAKLWALKMTQLSLGPVSFPAVSLVPAWLLHCHVENTGNKKTDPLKNALVDLMRQNKKRAKL